MKITCTRYHDISCGHRVVGHEGKCALMHGHNYRIYFTCEAQKVDAVGRVVDFGVIKSRLCEWLETMWDHKFLAWEDDPVMRELMPACGGQADEVWQIMNSSIVWVPFNPTAENMADFLLTNLGHFLLGTGCALTRVVVEETRKCSATVEL